MKKDIEILVIGAGPAGLSAAIEAAKCGAEVLVVDENNKPGGQLFKQIHKFFGSRRHKAGTRGVDIGTQLLEEVEKLGVTVMLNTVAYGFYPNGEGVALAVNGEEGMIVHPKKVIMATGASENPLAFPGWTLPGVVGAGAIQTMINVHRVSVGQRVLMIGSGTDRDISVITGRNRCSRNCRSCTTAWWLWCPCRKSKKSRSSFICRAYSFGSSTK